LETKWLDGNTRLKNDLQGRQVFPLAGTSLGKFLGGDKMDNIDVELMEFERLNGK
jgi:hypothetical protein